MEGDRKCTDTAASGAICRQLAPVQVTPASNVL